MGTYFFDIWIVVLLVWEYYKREKSHKMIIENLKNGTLPELSNNQKGLLGIILISAISVIFFGFLIYITLFFPIKIHPLFLISPFGIGITIMLLWRRDLLLYRKQRRSNTVEGV